MPGSQPGSMTGAIGYCYLIHFLEPYRHARHYLGWAEDLPARLARHQAGRGARLMAVITEAGIGWELARVWPRVDRYEERRLKKYGGHSRLCPLCRGTGTAVNIGLFTEESSGS